MGNRKELIEEVNTLLKASFGIEHEVVFTRQERVSIPGGKKACLSIGWGKGAQVNQSAGLCPTSRLMPCLVDIYARDIYDANEVYEKLLEVLKGAKPRWVQFVQCDDEPLYDDNLQTDGVRATILCRYIA